MKKILGLLFVIIILGLIFFKPNKKVKPFSKIVAGSVDKKINWKLQKNSNFSSKDKIVHHANSNNELPIHCMAYWDKMVISSIEDTMSTIEFDSNYDFSCFDYILPNNTLDSQMQNVCELDENKKIKNSQTCGQFLMIYRAVLIDSNTNENYGEHSLQVLLNKFIGKMIKGEEYWRTHKDDMYRLAHEIIGVEPHNPSSFKNLTVLNAMFQNYDGMLKSAEEGLKLNGQDRDLRNAWFFSMTKSPGFTETTFGEIYKSDDQAQYWMAAYMKQAGNLEIARQMLKDLVVRFPDNTIYQKTYIQSLETDDPNANIFELKVPIFEDTW